MSTRREELKDISRQASTHPGLWIDKFLTDARDRTDKRGAHLAEMSKPNIPEGYRAAFDRRREALLSAWQPEGALVATGSAEIEGRMIIGLGQKGVLEAGITLDHTWGVPFLPGSALKGLAARAAMQLVEDEAW
ncbi:type III-B CRISPR module RAMP protein Cmr6, partial [Myxococcota bacterium]|nr:type III-B CRISPR module RAMP protein Cmr6 [Myxococcota bacterium]